MKFTTKERKKSIKVIVSDLERALIEEKMKSYNYPSIASYVRDSAIYEKITHVDLKGKKDIYDAYAKNTSILKEILKEFKYSVNMQHSFHKKICKKLHIQCLRFIKIKKL